MTSNPLTYEHDLEKKGVEVNVRSSADSVFSDISRTSTIVDTSDFHPGSTLYISARGIGVLRFPLPSSELEISIFHNDGTLAYTSTRAKRSSSSAVLSHPKVGDLISTTYFFGPNREPVLKFLQSANNPTNDEDDANSVKVVGKWTSRSTAFMTADGRVFEWSYARTKDSNGKRVNIIALREKKDLGAKSDKQGKVIAQLIRSDETRAEGSSKCSAGNGGQLVLDQDATSQLDEALIVATCLMMLKKEIDRRRLIQIMMISGAASGGP